MVDELLAVTVGRVREPAHLAWAEGQTVSLPSSLASDLRPCLIEGDLRLDTYEELNEVLDNLRLRAAFTERMPTSSRLPVSYQRVPSRVRALIGRVVGTVERRRTHSWARFPRWPIDLSADFVADLMVGDDGPEDDETATPVWLSHDLDTKEGLRSLVDYFLDIEEAVGARSTNFVVPCSWDIDHESLGCVLDRGHEIGIHGYDHSNKTPFCDSEERQRRLDAAGNLIERYGIIGYRAPSLVRTRSLLRDLAIHYRYDSSIPTSGGRFPIPNNGCASARPFVYGQILELPLSLPRDGSLRFLGYAPEEILDLWKRCADLVRRSRGLVSLLTHCEARFSGNPAMLDVYRQFLEFISKDGRYRFTTAGSLVANAEMSMS